MVAPSGKETVIVAAVTFSRSCCTLKKWPVAPESIMVGGEGGGVCGVNCITITSEIIYTNRGHRPSQSCAVSMRLTGGGATAHHARVGWRPSCPGSWLSHGALLCSRLSVRPWVQHELGGGMP
jgi:hypothetical protein